MMSHAGHDGVTLVTRAELSADGELGRSFGAVVLLQQRHQVNSTML
jgi:hypothetical protein